MSYITVMKKQDLAKLITDKNYATAEEVADLSRVDMIKLIKSKEEAEAVISAPVEAVKEQAGFLDVGTVESVISGETSETSSAALTNDVIPIQSPDWTDNVKAQLTDKEKIDGFPTTDGLRRLFEKFIGEIISVKVDSIQCPHQDNAGRATVKVAISYAPYGIYDGSNYRGIKVIEDMADCFIGNTAAPYYTHASATATTMAEGRCYKKGLRLRTHTKEEMSGPQGAEAEIAAQLERIENPAATNQKLAIVNICKKNGIDHVKFLNSAKDITVRNIEEITSQEAMILINQLNKYQKTIADGGEKVPEEILLD